METQFPDWMFALAGVVATPIIALIKVKFQSRQTRPVRLTR